MSGPIKRNVLSYQQKREIIQEMDNGVKNVDVCKKYGLPSSTVASIWKFRHKILAMEDILAPMTKRARMCQKVDVDQAVYEWCRSAMADGVRLSVATLKSQAEAIARDLGHEGFQCSNGWLYRFRMRHNIQIGKPRGPQDKPADSPENEWLKMVWEDVLRDRYDPRDVYCAHEVGLFFDATPDMTSTLAHNKCQDGQLSNLRVTMLLCCNMDGSHKRPLVVIGSAPPPDFKEMIGLPVTYLKHPKSWMTSDVFEKEMFLWDEELRLVNKRILLLVNTSPAHIRLNSLESIHLCFLPREAPGLQPIERGISRFVRSAYRRQLIAKMSHKVAPSRVNLSEALKLANHSWESVTPEIISDSFLNAGYMTDSSCGSTLYHVGIGEWLKEFKLELPTEDLINYEFVDDGIATTPPEDESENPDEHVVAELGVLQNERSNGNSEGSPAIKSVKPNPCVGCLGLLQEPYCDDIVDSIINGVVDAKEYDSKTYNLSMNFPSCYLLRSEALLVELRKHFPAFYEEQFKGENLLALKDAFKACFGTRLGDSLNLSLDLTSGFVIDVEFKYDGDSKECNPLCSLKPQVFTSSYVRKNGYPKNRIESILDETSDEDFVRYFPVPPSIPSTAIKVVKATVTRESTNVAVVCFELNVPDQEALLVGTSGPVRLPVAVGTKAQVLLFNVNSPTDHTWKLGFVTHVGLRRYNKFCRELPQTPWVLNGERKMESSVEEIISGPIVAKLGGVSSKFASSGREDVDVRSLGRGRPFNVEVLLPKRAFLSYEDFRDLEKEIAQTSMGKLRVRDLQIVSRESLSALKQGEEEKTKSYSALCICPGGIPDTLEDATRKAPVVLDQSTPIRVLHRRPVAVRKREILEMSAKRIEGDNQKFILTVRTQAGTYVKEFIHGDFGRTKPSFGDLLGGVKVDILALDVTEIALNWPPRIDINTNDDNQLSKPVSSEEPLS